MDKFWKGVFLVVVSNVIWGIGAVVITSSVQEYGVNISLLGRFAYAVLGYIALFPLLRSFSFKQFRVAVRNPWAWIIAFGLVYGTLYPLFKGSSMVSPGIITLVWNFFPFLSALVGYLIMEEKLNRFQIIAGLVIVVSSVMWGISRYGVGQINAGVVWILLSVLVYLLSLVLDKLLIPERLLEEISFLGSLVAFFLTFIQSYQSVSSMGISFLLDWRLAYLGIAMTLIAGYLFVKAGYYIGMAEATVFMYLQAPVTILTEVLVLNAPLGISDLIFLSLILVGLIIVVYGSRRSLSNKTA